MERSRGSHRPQLLPLSIERRPQTARGAGKPTTGRRSHRALRRGPCALPAEPALPRSSARCLLRRRPRPGRRFSGWPSREEVPCLRPGGPVASGHPHPVLCGVTVPTARGRTHLGLGGAVRPSVPCGPRVSPASWEPGAVDAPGARSACGREPRPPRSPHPAPARRARALPAPRPSRLPPRSPPLLRGPSPGSAHASFCPRSARLTCQRTCTPGVRPAAADQPPRPLPGPCTRGAAVGSSCPVLTGCALRSVLGAGGLRPRPSAGVCPPPPAFRSPPLELPGRGAVRCSPHAPLRAPSAPAAGTPVCLSQQVGCIGQANVTCACARLLA